MCEDLEKELERGSVASAEVVHHVRRMGASALSSPIEIDGELWEVSARFIRKKDEVPSGKNWCCFHDCKADAVFKIIDSNESRYDVAETHACEFHVGQLLGSVEPTESKGPWHVYPL